MTPQKSEFWQFLWPLQPKCIYNSLCPINSKEKSMRGSSRDNKRSGRYLIWRQTYANKDRFWQALYGHWITWLGLSWPFLFEILHCTTLAQIPVLHEVGCWINELHQHCSITLSQPDGVLWATYRHVYESSGYLRWHIHYECTASNSR